MAHSKGFAAIANAYQEEDALSSGFEATTTIAPLLARNGSYVDIYFYESHQIEDADEVLNAEDYVSVTHSTMGWKPKAENLRSYQIDVARQNRNFVVLSITTTTTVDGFEQTRFDYSWHSAFLYGHEATGWGEFDFSATSEANAPLRLPTAIPAPGPGTVFTADPTWSQGDSLVTRPTDEGTITVDTSDHTGRFD